MSGRGGSLFPRIGGRLSRGACVPQEVMQKIVDDAVGTLKQAASLRFNLKGGPDREFLRNMQTALATPANAKAFLLQDGQEIEGVRTAVFVLLQCDASDRIANLRNYIQELLNRPASSTAVTTGATD